MYIVINNILYYTKKLLNSAVFFIHPVQPKLKCVHRCSNLKVFT